MENTEKQRAALEALLFIHGEPLSYKKIQAVLKIESRDDLDVIIAMKIKPAAGGCRG